jgi:hypothetical protein
MCAHSRQGTKGFISLNTISLLGRLQLKVEKQYGFVVQVCAECWKIEGKRELFPKKIVKIT